MGAPADHLPPPISEDAINQLLQLVLRVAGNHLPNIKTKNEIGVMTWLSKNTTIPLPDVIAYDSFTNIPVGHEYTLLSHIQGVTLSDVYDRLSDEQMNQILDQLIDLLTQLQAHPWDCIGGLTLDDQGEVQLGPVVDETFWQVPDIEALWPEGASGDSEHRRTIQDLAFMRDIVPRLEAFVASLPKHANELNNVKLRLAHKDLYFANMMFDSLPGKITDILDWEFAGVVPYPQWNPRSSFLWNGIDTSESLNEKYRLLEVFKQRCKEKGCTLFQETEYTSTLQDDMQRAVDFLWAIAEISPRGQRQELVQGWKDMVLENIEKFGA
ncbi:hypothetical protein FocTR4_00014610 [Fusarium oxysporum f. sp. cubense]|uniref:Aminoglycoside phosphotransferase domain-containing protein n=1 Tax=Fusarium oxysporum f. sp. cubense TaxID=61366 RepID=A0A5C6SLU3_FUSOC|nr:hypothetical protein FocTR4_00014610 [Fusarium oxysporum f. sp. cubense]